MKYIVPIAVIGIFLLQFSGAVPQASVGGAMTLALGFSIAAAAVGIYEAWSKRRGVLGWLLSIVVAFVGGVLIGGMIGSFVLDLVMTLVSFEGALAGSGHPLLYIMLAVQMLFVLFGAWIALQLVNKLR
jgi:hypothetical protein